MNNYLYKNIALVLFLTFAILFTGCNKGPKFDKLIPFQEEQNGDWGYINFKGKKVIETSFTKPPSLFYDGLAIVMNKDETYDFIDKEGNDKGKNYKSVTSFSEGLACVVEKDKRPIIINKSMETIVKLEEVEEISNFSEGLAVFQNRKGKWGYMNNKGEIEIEAKYDNALIFHDGLALVEVVEEIVDTIKPNKDENTTEIRTEKKKKYFKGYIDKLGNEVIELTDKFAHLSSFSEGLAAYSDDFVWGWGFINKKGEKVIRANPDWDDITLFHEGYASVKVNYNWGLINKKGQFVIPPKYDEPLVISNGYAYVELDDGYGFINSKGEIVIEPAYEDVAMKFHSGKAIVEDELGFYQIINKKGKIINKIQIYDVTLPERSILVKSDFFDIEPLIDTVLFDLNDNGIVGLTKESSVSSALTRFGLSDDDLPRNTWKTYLSIPELEVNDADISRTVYFSGSVSSAIKKYYSYWYYSYYETVGYKPSSSSRATMIEFNIELKNRGLVKGEKLAEGIKDALEARDFVVKEENKEEMTIVMQSQKTKMEAEISYRPDNVNLEITLSD